MPVNNNAIPVFHKLCGKYNLPRLCWDNKRAALSYLRIKRLYFCDMENPKPDSEQSEESKKIVWKRLKSHMEYMSSLGGCPVVCASESNTNERQVHRRGFLIFREFCQEDKTPLTMAKNGSPLCKTAVTLSVS